MNIQPEDAGSDQDMLRNFLRITSSALILIGNCICYYALTIPFFCVISTLQEHKIWKTTSTPMTLFGALKCFGMNACWMCLTLLGSLALLPMWMQRGFGKSVEKEAHCVIEKLASLVSILGFIGEVEIIGEENLPELTLNGQETGPAPVFIANHCSQIDTGVVYFAIRRFKWIAKQSVRLIPGPGNIMSLAGHIFIKRAGKNSNSKTNLFDKSNEAIQKGIPMLIFPQGTRSMSEKLPFKFGAFKIAIENESLLVPISINIPLGVWNSLFPLSLLWGDDLREENKITITVHKGIQATKDSNIDELKEKCSDVIYSVLAVPAVGKELKMKTN